MVVDNSFVPFLSNGVNVLLGGGGNSDDNAIT
jgi:hypothetical protein